MARRILPLALVLLFLLPEMSFGARRRRVRGVRMEATAFSQAFRPTASGTLPHRGIVAADPAVLPLGSRIRVAGAGWSGIYLVTDTGSRIRGRHIDIFIPSTAAARRFGRQTVLVELLEPGEGKLDARWKDQRPAPHG